VRRRSPQLHSVRVVRHECPVGVHGKRPHPGPGRPQGRTQQLRAVLAANDGRAPDEYARQQQSVGSHEQREEGIR